LKYGKKLTWIKIHFEEKTDHMNIIYEDDGVGIPASEKPKLFNQGYSTGGSTGYGLYLIKKITEVYGWTVKENGEAGRGAVFVMTIPKTYEGHRINYKLH
jgi:signal transduction histidine kinase